MMAYNTMLRGSSLGSSLGILLGGAAAVGSLVVGLVLGSSAWLLCALVGGLSLWALSYCLRPPHRLWHWTSLVAGSGLGMVAGLSLALGVSSNGQLQVALEAASFEAAVMGALERSQCELASDLLIADLSLLPQRPALSVPVRWEMWAQAAAYGCVSGEYLSKARKQLVGHLETARTPPGINRDALLRQMGRRAPEI